MRGTLGQAAALMKPYAGAIEAWEVGAEVGNVKNNWPELMERVGVLSARKPAPSPAMTQHRHRHVGRGGSRLPEADRFHAPPETKRDRSGPA
jgi:hypothetical protein